MSVTLYQLAPSFYSQIVRLALAEKHVGWVEHRVNIGPAMENYQPWFMRLHPMGVVPVLDHDGTIVTEAIQIVRYIDQTFAGSALTPDEREQRERMDAWLHRLNAFQMREVCYGWQMNTALRPMVALSFILRRKVLTQRMSQSPDLASRYQARLDDIDAWQKISTDKGEVAKLEQQARSILENLEQDLTHGKPWLLGGQYTLADVWLTIFLARLTQFKKNAWWEEGRLSRVTAYYQRLRARPSFRAADIWDEFRVGFILRMVAPFVLPRFAAAASVLTFFSFGGWWLLS